MALPTRRERISRFIDVAGCLYESSSEQPAGRVLGQSATAVISRLEECANRSDALVCSSKAGSDGACGCREARLGGDALEEEWAVNDDAEVERAP